MADEPVVSLDVPHIAIKGFYSIDGKVLILPIKGAGPFDATLKGTCDERHGSMERFAVEA